ncbi:MAG: hypothetical protein D6730_17105 [Bacteroidetes bacterium]|nr:MAG: hypothetical protein D6730_17105 [Bacteroidota bacterium]
MLSKGDNTSFLMCFWLIAAILNTHRPYDDVVPGGTFTGIYGFKQVAKVSVFLIRGIAKLLGFLSAKERA